MPIPSASCVCQAKNGSDDLLVTRGALAAPGAGVAEYSAMPIRRAAPGVAMAGPTLIPDSESLELEELVADDAGVTVVVRASRPTACCPDCEQPATRVHSWYERRLGDLHWQGLPVRVRLYTRRWFCDAPGCTRRIFTERFPALVPPHGRRTARLSTLLTALAFALGGRPGARLLAAIGPVVSHDTLINTIRQADLPPAPTPRVLGYSPSMCKNMPQGTVNLSLR